MVEPWQPTGEVENIQIGHRTIQRKTFIKNDGDRKIADVAGADGLSAAFVIALTPENRVIIARQFRCGPEKLLDELPGGLVDPGETPSVAAKRELQEEVGYSSDRIEEIGAAYTDAWDTLTRYYYLAYDCYPVTHTNPDKDEEIETVTISIGELFENARDRNMIDVTALYFAYDKLKAMEVNK